MFQNIKTFYNNTVNSKTVQNVFLFIILSLIFTLLMASKHFFFSSLTGPDNLAREDVYAQNTIEVVDTFKTDQRKKELAQKLNPVMRVSEDMFVNEDFDQLINSVNDIRKSKLTLAEKNIKMMSLFDLNDKDKEKFTISYLLSLSDNSMNLLTVNAKHTLKKILTSGISENDTNLFTRSVYANTDENSTLAQKKVISGILEQVVMSNMVLDEEATEAAKKTVMDSVAPIRVIFEKGDKIISKGERLSKIKKDALVQAGHSIINLNLKGMVGVFSLCLLGITAIYGYLSFFEKKLLTKRRIFIISLLSFLLIFTAVIIPFDWTIYILPVPAYVIMLSVFTNPRTASYVSVVMIVMISLSLWIVAAKVSVLILAALFTALCMSNAKFMKRIDLVRVGLEVALINALCIGTMYLLQLCLTDITLKYFLNDLIFGVLNCVFSGIIALGMLPLLENISGITTPYGIAEMGDINQPLLKRLQFEAPGTFSHSLLLSTFAEAAAEAIGADSLLARVGAMYHDIGKLKRPLFFIENQNYFGIENPHCKLNPRLSKMVIVSHVKDGLEIAKEYKLPDIIKDFIAQHHGTTLASYFYSRALKQEGVENVSREQFRYPGPKPLTKEVAIVMIADAVESASRTLKEYSKEELEKLINKIIVERLNDGQLSECPLSLHDLKIIAETLGKTLRASHHQRIKYHDNIIEELENRANLRAARKNNEKITDAQLKSTDEDNEKH